MIAIPAIDLKDGKVVRLVQGRYSEFVVYSHDPTEIARVWQKEGAERIHVIDLDGALAGEPQNITAVRQIVEDVDIPVQFGGGLRSYEDIAAVLSMGAQWAILGTKAYEDLNFVKEIIDEFSEQIIVSIDAKYKKVAVCGWTNITEMEDIELIKRLQDIGVATFIYTDISRDGTLTGINVEWIRQVLKETGASMFYSGGISSMEDIKELRGLEQNGLAGIIIGKAFYENKIHLVQVKRVLQPEDEAVDESEGGFSS